MDPSTRKITESTFDINLNELSHSITRELTMALKKVAIYGTGHPVSVKSLDKPWMVFGQIFKVKQQVNINLYRGELYVLNISQPDNVFTKEIIKFMQLHDIKVILFHEALTKNELALFSDKFVKRSNLANPENHLSKFFKGKNIQTIEINSEYGYDYFENNRQYRGDVAGDFSVRCIALDQIAEDVKLLTELSKNFNEACKKYYIDFHQNIIEYLMPEKIASIPSEKFRQNVNSYGNSIAGTEPDHSSNESFFNSLASLLDYHPNKELILSGLKNSPLDNAGSLSLTESSQLKLTPRQVYEKACENYFNSEFNFETQIELFNSFVRLFKTGNAEFGINSVENLMEKLSDPHPDIRQRSLNVILTIIENYNDIMDRDIIEAILNYCIISLNVKQETYEYSEIIWQIICLLVKMSDFESVTKLTDALAQRKSHNKDSVVFDSMVIKQVYSNLNKKEFLHDFVNRLIKTDTGKAKYIRKILIDIGSEEAASELVDVISHPDRSVRQQSLKMLAEMGKSAVKVCSQVITDDNLFSRDNDRYELPDNKWYIIRNAIFVLGQLRDEDGIVALRLRIGDNDIRVRRDIIIALEKIGGEDACDILFLMLDDPIKEISERAIITISLIGNDETAPLLIDAIKRDKTKSILIITALGKVGGEEALKFLSSLLANEAILEDYVTGQVSKDDLKLTLIKALGNLNDSQAVKQIKDYQDNLSKTQKIFFKNSPLNKTISDIVSRQK